MGSKDAMACLLLPNNGWSFADGMDVSTYPKPMHR